ncbi:MAG: DUF962 domain-containing protein [Sulfobacillus benefaciens]|uniref:DUF962 domain-containing protein n=1 Tax=Sulfobacillus benefaciens TaxID=453960 RepID=A0A2T2XCI5_9FIRM|nr:MAG: DUF962 domain-containing protein [Sulfobacillus benefaciens]
MKIRSFDEFWPYYLDQHRETGTRLLHFIGTGLALLSILTAIFTLNIYYILLAPILGYGLAWYSHMFIERNKPATWQYPWWSLEADFRLFLLILTRGLYTNDTMIPKLFTRRR